MQAANLNQVAAQARNNLKEKYLTVVRPKLKETLGKKNVYQTPFLEKIVVNVGFGKIAPDEKTRDQVAADLAKITGQKPIFTAAKKAIAAFKTRKGQIIGVKVTLRGNRMNHFFEKLVSIVLPRIRDFRGVSEESFDRLGNYTLGFREANVFPEVEYGRADKPIGLEVTICTTGRTDEEARALLTELGMPFKTQKTKQGQKGDQVS